jgi:hypothetical protein
MRKMTISAFSATRQVSITKSSKNYIANLTTQSLIVICNPNKFKYIQKYQDLANSVP